MQAPTGNETPLSAPEFRSVLSDVSDVKNDSSVKIDLHVWIEKSFSSPSTTEQHTCTVYRHTNVCPTS